MPVVFNRTGFTQIRLVLSSNEALGLLDSDYLEDYYGTDGQVTLRQASSGTTYPVLMADVTSGPVPHEVFAGYVDLSDLVDGDYEILGRVRDLLGNYTVLGDFASPFGSASVEDLRFTLVTLVEQTYEFTSFGWPLGTFSIEPVSTLRAGPLSSSVLVPAPSGLRVSFGPELYSVFAVTVSAGVQLVGPVEETLRAAPLGGTVVTSSDLPVARSLSTQSDVDIPEVQGAAELVRL